MSKRISTIREFLSHPVIGFLVTVILMAVPTSLALAGVINKILAYGLLCMGWLMALLAFYLGLFISLSKKYATGAALLTTIIFGTLALAEIYLSSNEERLGPHLEFGGIHAEHKSGSYHLTIYVSNTSEIPATAVSLISSVLSTEPSDTLNNKEVNDLIASIEEQMKSVRLSPVAQMQITRGMGVELPLKAAVSDADYDSVIKGTKDMYVVLLATYIDPKITSKHIWVTELCARIQKPFTGFQPCTSHNRYFLSDYDLHQVNN